MNYLSHLSRNEALLEYYQTINEGLCSLFIQAKISDGNFKIDGGTAQTTALSTVGELIPEVG